MWTISGLLHKFRCNKRGLSNVIVVVLSLVILVIIASNIILWSYEMNQLDWEKMQENFAVINIQSNKQNWAYSPTSYTLGESTILQSGSVSNLTSEDGIHMTFRSISTSDTSDVVFVGSSNTETWSHTNWTVSTAWSIGSVNVTLQLYDFSLDGYSLGGDGFVAYVSDDIPNTFERKNQTISSNPTRFKNATGYWKLRVKGTKNTTMQFDFLADLVEIRPTRVYVVFSLHNGGSLTSHLVSLWVSNSTHHQRYDIDVFVNSGETWSYVDDKIILPKGSYLAKVVSERGNIAVYSGS